MHRFRTVVWIVALEVCDGFGVDFPAMATAGDIDRAMLASLVDLGFDDFTLGSPARCASILTLVMSDLRPAFSHSK
jgi:hypothetical protein